MKFIIAALGIIFFLAKSCIIGQNMKKGHDVEVIDRSFRMYAHEDTLLRRPFWPTTERIWFKDSFAIEQVRQIKIDEDGKGRQTTTYPVLLYRFTNLRTAEVYEYKSFSDTASLIRKYIYSDSVKSTGGWGFYLYRGLSDSTSIRYLPDTVINGTKYGHAFFTRRMSGIDYNIDGWFLTEKRATHFSLDQASYRTTGIPMVGYHLYPQGPRGLNAISEVTFIADELTALEEKIFTTWVMYAIRYPVKKESLVQPETQ